MLEFLLNHMPLLISSARLSGVVAILNMMIRIKNDLECNMQQRGMITVYPPPPIDYLNSSVQLSSAELRKSAPLNLATT